MRVVPVGDERPSRDRRKFPLTLLVAPPDDLKVMVNSVAVHAAMPSLPFGGIGNSGIGCHHGYEGFQTFSHARSIFRRGSVNAWELMRPPWGEAPIVLRR